MACNNECSKSNGSNGGLVILVLYILLAILIGSRINNNYYY